MYRIGIDLGGTNIKAVILDDHNDIIASDSTPTGAAEGFNTVMNNIVQCIRGMFATLALPEDASAAENVICGGMTIPGQICGPEGPVLFAPNLGWNNTDPVGYLMDALGIPFVLGNDADCIALAEAVVGSAKDYKSILMLALGTGVGGAYILNRRIFDGFGAFGGEFGHIPLVHGGRLCPCGLRGCFEQYCSAASLTRIAQEALRDNLAQTSANGQSNTTAFGKDTSVLSATDCQDHRDSDAGTPSLLWELCGHDPDRLTTVHLFEAGRQNDPTACRVLDEFFDHLAEGITGLINIFRPEAVLIGGGLAEAKEALFVPINHRVRQMTFAHQNIPAPPVIRAELGIYAGAIGAALMQDAR